MKKLTLFILVFIISINVYSQKPDCECCTEFYKQFDFWLGDWEVFDHNDNKQGENSIIKLQNNCVLQENWTSQSMTGTSYNFYNSTDSTWNQVWIDNLGNSLILKGKFIDGKMILKGDLLKGQQIDWYYNQISWEKDKDGNVIQTWDTFDKDDNLITTVFKGIYKRKSETR